VTGDAGLEHPSIHSAASAALGYLYQADCGLFELIRRSRDEPNISMTFEFLDDVAFESAGRATELLQTKHHVNRTATLSDASPDLWRSVRSWLDVLSTHKLDSKDVALTLLTTAHGPSDGIAGALRPGAGRDVQVALTRMERTASTSKSKDNGTAYQAFLGLNREQRVAFVSSIVILDAARPIDEVGTSIAREVRHAAEERLRPALVTRLMGWWHDRIISALRAPAHGIEAREVELAIDDLREQFKADNLPIDDWQIGEDGGELSKDDRIFLRQLQLVAANSRVMELALRDYKRAFLQRSRWLNDELTTMPELERYESRLIDEWEHQRALMDDDTGNEVAAQRAGLILFRDLHNADVRIRERCAAPFVLRGSLHLLADDLRVGWHPEFLSRLRHLLEGTAS
jgi:hypothetical protein